MIRIGVTGGIGSGKSTVCRMFGELGAAVYDTDANAKRLMNTDADIRRRLTDAFGEKVYADGVLDRSFLASAVFGNAERLAVLNGIVHPAVRDDFRRWCSGRKEDYAVLESAILFEAGFDAEVDRTLAVVAPRSLRIERVCRRSGLTPEQIEARMSHQMSDDELRDRADYTIVNISLDYLRSDVGQLDKMFRYEAHGGKIRG